MSKVQDAYDTLYAFNFMDDKTYSRMSATERNYQQVLNRRKARAAQEKKRRPTEEQVRNSKVTYVVMTDGRTNFTPTKHTQGVMLRNNTDVAQFIYFVRDDDDIDRFELRPASEIDYYLCVDQDYEDLMAAECQRLIDQGILEVSVQEDKRGRNSKVKPKEAP